MKTVNQILSNPEQIGKQPLPEQPLTTNQPRTSDDFTAEERDRTGYFFLRLKAVYNAEYMRHFPDVESVNLAKREWAKQIGAFSREQIDTMFTLCKQQQAAGDDDYRFLNIGGIIGLLSSDWQHARIERAEREWQQQRKALPDMTKRERSAELRRKTLDSLKSMFAGTKA